MPLVGCWSSCAFACIFVSPSPPGGTSEPALCGSRQQAVRFVLVFFLLSRFDPELPTSICLSRAPDFLQATSSLEMDSFSPPPLSPLTPFNPFSSSGGSPFQQQQQHQQQQEGMCAVFPATCIMS